VTTGRHGHRSFSERRQAEEKIWFARLNFHHVNLAEVESHQRDVQLVPGERGGVVLRVDFPDVQNRACRRNPGGLYKPNF